MFNYCLLFVLYESQSVHVMFNNYRGCEEVLNLIAILPPKECFYFKMLVIYSNIIKTKFFYELNQINLKVT